MSLHLHRDLDKLKKEMLRLGNMVELAINNAFLALNNRDSSYVEEVLTNEEQINEMEVQIEEECLKILALHQPVAVDLRFLVVVLKVNNDLERMGDIAKNIAERAKDLMESEVIPDLSQPMQGLPDLVRTMVRSSLDSLVKLDDQLARKIIEMDDQVDQINRDMYAIVKSLVAEQPAVAGSAINLLSCSRNMERIGDLATNIAEDVIFVVDGKVVRHAE
ncbi:MAG: phosphate transport system regulatory protein PhoU [Gammaproteobacteria bacterium]|nr:phosphate transport system regulatory protein PhoU [Gammaproteobacteria bacterium]|tara:strand:- start:666 stop:1322 length:657 start_codon:yes stop_codon:yes gene_type:complete